MGKKSNLKKLKREQFGPSYNKTAKELMRKADLVGHTDRDNFGRAYTVIYNPVKRLVKMKPYKSDVAKQILAGTVEKYSNFIQQQSKETSTSASGTTTTSTEN